MSRARKPVVHIPVEGGVACGTNSWCAHVNTVNHLCRACQRALGRRFLGSITRDQLKRAILQHVMVGNRIDDPKGFVDRCFAVVDDAREGDQP